MKLCPRCNRNLDALYPCQDFVHYRADNPKIPCMELSDFYEMWMRAEEEYLNKRFQKTMDETLRSKAVSR